MLMNYHFAYTAEPTIAFDVPMSGVREVDKATGKEMTVRDGSPAFPGCQIFLDAGEARLFLLPGKADGATEQIPLLN